MQSLFNLGAQLVLCALQVGSALPSSSGSPSVSRAEHFALDLGPGLPPGLGRRLWRTRQGPEGQERIQEWELLFAPGESLRVVQQDTPKSRMLSWRELGLRRRSLLVEWPRVGQLECTEWGGEAAFRRSLGARADCRLPLDAPAPRQALSCGWFQRFDPLSLQLEQRLAIQGSWSSPLGPVFGLSMELRSDTSLASWSWTVAGRTVLAGEGTHGPRWMPISASAWEQRAKQAGLAALQVPSAAGGSGPP